MSTFSSAVNVEPFGKYSVLGGSPSTLPTTNTKNQLEPLPKFNPYAWGFAGSSGGGGSGGGSVGYAG